MESDKLLSIVIPTYNRRNQLLRQLRSIYSQKESHLVNIVICDNHSDYDVVSTIEKEFGKEITKNLQVHVNETNIGLHANLALMFTHCNTEWMWSLSDDDETMPDSIRIILDEIQHSHNVIMYKYGFSGYNSYDDQDFTSLKEIIDFYDKNQKAGHLVFLSNNVYNMSYIRKYYSNTISYCFCAYAQLLPVFFALEDKSGIVKLKNTSIVDYLPPAPGSGWNYLNTAISFSVLPLFPFNLSSHYYQKMGAMIMTGFSHKRIIYLCLTSEDRRRGKFLYNQIYGRTFKYSKSYKNLLWRIIFILLYYLHINPSMTWNK